MRHTNALAVLKATMSIRMFVGDWEREPANSTDWYTVAVTTDRKVSLSFLETRWKDSLLSYWWTKTLPDSLCCQTRPVKET